MDETRKETVETAGSEKTFTQAEVDALLQSEADKRVSAALKKAESKNAKAIAEATKLAQMSAEDKSRYELEQRELKIAEKEKQLAVLENKNEASKILADKGLDLALVDFIVAEDADTMMSNIKMLDVAFKNSVKNEVEKRLKGSTPKDNLHGPSDVITKEQFKKMSLAEMAAIERENPTLFKELIK